MPRRAQQEARERALDDRVETLMDAGVEAEDAVHQANDWLVDMVAP